MMQNLQKLALNKHNFTTFDIHNLISLSNALSKLQFLFPNTVWLLSIKNKHQWRFRTVLNLRHLWKYLYTRANATEGLQLPYN
ncbi:hypothetical protein EGR_10945 [Echinococcus granulosus]|uniref:Uncharacterized protein n=1 Tax=Echinococcus granulosus TaxID=6210 RepID=W6UL13_ECHGR|nr:hypothetical protein EGR_10945 [Echinococcus granulosus]EUB54194.1 hypothetical protein EGR_10945 [Echinococcus granulosus]